VVQPGVVGVVGVVVVLLEDEPPQPLRLNDSPSNTNAIFVFFTRILLITCVVHHNAGQSDGLLLLSNRTKAALKVSGD
jgi:hypothetical protein